MNENSLIYEATPDYLKAADFHNLASGNESIFTPEYAASLPGRGIKYAVGSIISGGNSIYNSAVTVANWMGAGMEEAKAGDVMAKLDSNLADYYEENKTGMDTLGFLATSFIPGMAGVKVFNAGQKALNVAMKTGSVGSNLAKTVGLVPTIEQSVLSAGKELAESGAKLSLSNANVLKAIGGGFQQAAWESAAFEVAVTATMFKAPMLENQDYKDIASNVVTGALLGGAIGGVFSAATTWGKIGKVVKEADLAEKPFTLRTATQFLDNDPGSRLVAYANDLRFTPAEAPPGLEGKLADRLMRIREDIRLAGMTLVGKDDTAMGSVIAESMLGMDADQLARVASGARRIVRPNDLGKVGDDEVVGFLKLHGEGTGDISLEVPKLRTLADEFTGNKVKTAQQQIDDFVASQNFSPTKAWNPVLSPPSVHQARYMWAESLTKLPDNIVINQYDIPLLEAALRLGKTEVQVDFGTTLVGQAGKKTEEWIQPIKLVDLENTLRVSKQELGLELQKASKAKWIGDTAQNQVLDTEAIARMVNVSPEFLESTETAAMYARQTAQGQYAERLAAAGIKKSAQPNLDYIPLNAAVVYRKANDINGDLVSAMTTLKSLQKVQQQAVDGATVKYLGEDLFKQIVHTPDQIIALTNREGAGAGMFTFANGGYGTPASIAEQNGKVTNMALTARQATRETLLNSPAMKLRGNQDAAIEVFSFNNEALKISGFDQYVWNDAKDGMILSKVAEYNKAVQAGQKASYPELPQGAQIEIKFRNPEAIEFLDGAHQLITQRTATKNTLHRAQGMESSLNEEAYYPYKPDPKTMPYFAFVKDETVTGAGLGHTSMIHAASETDLQAMIVKAKEAGFSVYTKSETEQYFKARLEYEFDKTLHENYIDSSLRSKGVNNYFAPKSDPNVIVDEILAWHSKADANLVRETVSTKLAKEMNQFQQLGDTYTKIASSRYGVTPKSIEASTQNPYIDYAKTSLNISRLSEYPILQATNKYLEQAVSGVYDTVKRAWREYSLTPETLEKANDALEKAGIGGYKDAAEYLLANSTAPQPVLTKFIRGANAILANTFLRIDPLNALNNAIGANVLLGKETTSLLRGIKNSNPELAGELSKLMEVSLPGVDDTIKSSSKLIASVMGDFVKGDKSEVGKWVTANGWGGRYQDIYRSMLEDLATTGAETPSMFGVKLQNALKKAQEITGVMGKATGNELAEEFNRFVAAGVAKKISDLGIRAGLMDESVQLAYVNTFVNRTQSNVLAAQRPMVFQGPLGQAIGLFQGYQFNVMQQLFRGVAESGAKDAAIFAGLQSTLYGLNGLPAFQYINQHIIGTASGNTQHTDAYSAIYGAAGNKVGDWLMYGAPSNLLQNNLYSRGDINPRRVTVLPTSPGEIAAVSAIGGFLGNLKETFGKIAGGGDVWQTIVQGIEHNGLSRPLAGLAQVSQAAVTGKVFSTTKSGDVSFVNDFWSLATLSRLAGGKPLDEALANDEISRGIFYKLNDSEGRKAATETFKTSVIDKQTPTEDAVKSYLNAWIKNGGRQEEFNKATLNAIMKANTPRANEVMRQFNTPYAQRMYKIMNGNLETFD